jgi:hypothetical protein
VTNKFNSKDEANVKQNIIDYVDGVISNKDNEDPEFVKFCRSFRAGDYMVRAQLNKISG